MQLKQTNTLRSVFEQGYAETRHFGAQGLTLLTTCFWLS